MLRLGKIVIHQAIVRALERAAVKVVKRDQGLEGLEVNPVDDLEVLGGGELPDHRRNHSDVGQLRKHAADFDRHRSIAYARHERSVGRLHDHIGADAGLALPGVIQHADGKSHDQQDQRDLERNGHNADQRPDGPVHQVGDDHFVHHGLVGGRQPYFFSVTTPCTWLDSGRSRCTIWAPAG